MGTRASRPTPCAASPWTSGSARSWTSPASWCLRSSRWTSSPRSRGVGEQGDRRGEPVQEVLSADWADLPGTVEARQRQAPELLRYQRRVVVGDREQSRASPVTREEQSSVGRLGRLTLEKRTEILVGGGRVPHVELDGLPDL